jgi:outer membrane protein, heavy metal efflux system
METAGAFMKRLISCCIFFAASYPFSPSAMAQEIALDLLATLEKAQAEYGPFLALKQAKVSAQASIQKATAWPNPELAFSWDDFPSSEKSGTLPGKFNLELQMPLEIGGKRSAKEQSAIAESDLADLETEKQKAELLTEISDAFLNLKEKNALWELAKQRRKLASRLADIATQKFQAGKLSGVEQSRLSSLAELAEIELGEKELNAKNASQRAASYIGRPSISSNNFIFPFDEVPKVIQVGQESPEGWVTRIAIAKSKKSLADVTLATKEAIPNLTIVAGTVFERSTRESLYSVGFSLPLPLFDRNQGGRKLAQAMNETVLAREKSLKVEVTRDLLEVKNSLEFSRTKALQLKNEVLPRLRESAKLLAEAYATGRVTYLEVVETQESLFSLEEKYLETLSKYHQSVFRLAFSSQVNIGLSKIASLYSVGAIK